METHEEFVERNHKEWRGIINTIFNGEVPESKEWTNINEIVDVLNTIGKVDNSNHLFFPDSGGLDLEGAKLSPVLGCIELDFQFIYLVKPKKLSFEKIEDTFEWSYFRLEADELEPTGIYKDLGDFLHEELLEISPGQYVHARYSEMGEYNGQPLPKYARTITRYLGGTFVIFKKTSIYNDNAGTYDGRQNKMSEDKFKEYITKSFDHIGGYAEV